MTQTPTIERLAYSPAEAGEALGLSRDRILSAIGKGQIKATKFNNRWLISRVELDRLLGNHPGDAGTARSGAANGSQGHSRS
jgi:excisionase family DNA binding protein